jgi:RNA polymerase sigma-70 factor (TIGR02960 family)
MQLIDQARAGDQTAFQVLVDPHRHELNVHCYRILGSLADAEDAVQETMLAAWQGLGGFEGRASIRTWLYRIATTRSLNMLRAASRRPPTAFAPTDVELPAATGSNEIVWLQPYPDQLLEQLPETTYDAIPEARYEAREAISLAFVTALQVLPAQQRAVLLLRDVLGFSARESADILDTSEQSVTSALKRARATLDKQLPAREIAQRQPPAAGSEEEQALVAKLTVAYESGDVDGLVELMTEDAWLRMPPASLEYQGRELVGTFFKVVAYRNARRYRLITTRANGQPAFGLYVSDRDNPEPNAFGLMVITLEGDRIAGITRFDNAALLHFDLPSRFEESSTDSATASFTD